MGEGATVFFSLCRKLLGRRGKRVQGTYQRGMPGLLFSATLAPQSPPNSRESSTHELACASRAHAGDGRVCRQTNGLTSRAPPCSLSLTHERKWTLPRRPRGAARASPCGRSKGGQQASYCTLETNGLIFCHTPPPTSRPGRLRHW